ncbi:hypothetical protein AMTRI_Chr06g169050 [Amborella trichopoda]
MQTLLKKPKLEQHSNKYEEKVHDENGKGVDEEEEDLRETEECLVALLQHRTLEVDNIKRKIDYYQSQLEGAQKKLLDAKSSLACHKARHDVESSKSAASDDIGKVKVEPKSSATPSPMHVDEGHTQNQPQLRPQLVIPAANLNMGEAKSLADPSMKVPSVSGVRSATSSSKRLSDTSGKLKGDMTSCKNSSEKTISNSNDKQASRKLQQRVHKDLISSIRTAASPHIIRFQTATLISNQGRRKMRSIALNPFNDKLFVTSSLDGVVKLWEVQAKGSSTSLLSSRDCLSAKRRWPEDITWHPDGDSLFSVYTADDGDSQVSVLNLNSSKNEVTYLKEKPHLRGIINNIIFMPWGDPCFATSGSDHAVILWNEKDGDNVWKPKVLHRNLHSSAVMGVAGMQNRQIILSAGADKRVIGFDLQTSRADYKMQGDNKCMGILPNPSDFNLFMVQTGTPQKQLHLYDIRVRQREIHAFGWKQISSDSQSALINQAWSPDGWYISSGSTDPMIHIFDIRYNSSQPCQSVKAHQKRVLRAAWHHSLPLLISISSDLHIGIHKINQ